MKSGSLCRTRRAELGATGVVLLIFVAVSLLGRIEETFNDIWGVNHADATGSWMQLYPTAIMLGPLLLITALGLAGGAHFRLGQSFHHAHADRRKIDFQPAAAAGAVAGPSR